MKKVKIPVVCKLLAFALLLLQISSFKISTKTAAPKMPAPAVVPATPIIGLWMGTYSVEEIPEQGELFYSFSIYPDGSILTKSKGGDGRDYYSSGQWELSCNNVFNAEIISIVTPGPLPVTQSITAIFSDEGLTNGTWTDIENPNGTGLKGKLHALHKLN